MDSRERRMFVMGTATGAAAIGLMAAMLGAAAAAGGNVQITQSADGRRAYSWSVDGNGNLSFLGSARASGKQDDGEGQEDADKAKGKGKPETTGKPADDDTSDTATGGQGKDKDKGRKGKP